MLKNVSFGDGTPAAWLASQGDTGISLAWASLLLLLRWSEDRCSHRARAEFEILGWVRVCVCCCGSPSLSAEFLVATVALRCREKAAMEDFYLPNFPLSQEVHSTGLFHAHACPLLSCACLPDACRQRQQRHVYDNTRMTRSRSGVSKPARAC